MDWTHRLRLRHLRMLMSIMQTGNLSQSAEELCTTQPALSKWLRELEEDIGLPLFERRARGLRPTEYGLALVEHARRIEGHLNNARDDMLALREGGTGLVSIGTSGVSAADTVPLATAALVERMPRAQIRLVESTMNQLMPQLIHGELDIVVGRAADTLPDPQLKNETLYRDPINFVSGLAHPLASRSSVDWHDLLDYRWIVWPAGTPVRTALEAALATAGHTMPRHCVESNSSILNVTLLNHSNLIGVASHRAAGRFARLNALHVLRMPRPLASSGAVAMYWRPDSESREAVALALDCLRRSAALEPDDAR
ncbi:LysR family transcriptional regulator [Burkholderia sp. WSM2230]|uniref:LysR family transcriptional regulator n=1 Tax=Burkholderia sp. WSM2230 TaxID=944435 RepID=UPI000471850F|nr:LysR substrate-binding domain-containing protein [Burkholderia sp. WSM2230]